MYWGDYEKVLKETIKITKAKLEYHIKVDKEENEELKNTFNEIKFKTHLPYKTKILKNGKFYTFAYGIFIIYDDKKFKKLYEIKFEKETNFRSVIQLDNNDLIFLMEKKVPSLKFNYEILNQIMIYRLKDNNYYLIQEINDESKDFELQKTFVGHGNFIDKQYIPNKLKDLSNNRFFSLSNYGIKFFSLNNNNNYVLVSSRAFGDSLVKIDIIQESIKNYFIISYYEFHPGYGLANYSDFKLIIEKISLKGTNSQQMLSLHYGDGGFNFYIPSTEHMILKKIFFIIRVDKYILIFNIVSGNLLKRFELNFNNNETMFNGTLCIKKWNNKKDNEFLLFSGNYIILFELNEYNLSLNIKAYMATKSRIIDQKNDEDLIKINDEENQFYKIDKQNITIY